MGNLTVMTSVQLHQHTKQIADQLVRTAGHVTSIKLMVEAWWPYTDVLVRLAAVRAVIECALQCEQPITIDAHLTTGADLPM